MNQIDTIVNNIVLLEPSWQEKRAELFTLVQKILAAKPDSKFDEGFEKRLRERLLERPVHMQSRLSPYFHISSLLVTALLLIMIISPLASFKRGAPPQLPTPFVSEPEAGSQKLYESNREGETPKDSTAPALAPSLRMEPLSPPSAAPLPEAPSSASGRGEYGVIAKAREDAAYRRGIPLAQVELLSIERVDWPDACLDISYQDMFCAQVITPGYLVKVGVGTTVYEYHTDITGERVIFAQEFSAQ